MSVNMHQTNSYDKWDSYFGIENEESKETCTMLRYVNDNCAKMPSKHEKEWSEILKELMNLRYDSYMEKVNGIFKELEVEKSTIEICERHIKELKEHICILERDFNSTLSVENIIHKMNNLIVNHETLIEDCNRKVESDR